MSDQVANQIEAWRHIPPESVEIARRVLGDKFFMAVPMALGGDGFHAVIRIVPVQGCDVSQYAGRLKIELDKIDWQFVAIPTEDQKAQRRFAMAPLTLRPATVTYHTTHSAKVETIQREGLLPSSPAIRQTDFPDTDGKIHVCEALAGDGSASRWVKIFCGQYSAKPEEYCILRVDLTGLHARVYQDVRSQYGLIVDKIDRIAAEQISFERLGHAEDLR